MKSTPAKLSCPECNYDLSGLPTLTCPECGKTFDLETIKRRRIPEGGRQACAIILGMVLCATAAGLAVSSNVPEPWAPFGLPSVIPAMFLRSEIGAVIGGGVFFLIVSSLWCWCWRTPIWMLAIAGVLAALSLVYVVGGQSYAEQYQSHEYALTMIVVDGLMIAGIALLGILSRIKPPGNRAYVWHLAFEVLLGVWFFTYAFPWMGELP